MIPKFKVWDKQKEKMFDQSEVVIWFDENGVGIVEDDYRADRLTDFKLLQSTGLFDKNGKEIYKGDILHHKVQGTAVVIYPFMDDIASFGTRNVNNGFGNTLQDTAKAGYEIIGNKFEHPHLLGEE